jgi:hypothetical protein
MKFIIIFLLFISLCSCSTNQRYTGQGFDPDNPTFYLSLAPSFGKPFEYELLFDNTLVYREYSGLGGYKWGTKKVIAKIVISREEEKELNALALEAIADTIKFEQVRNKSGVLEFVSDGTGWYLQSGIVPFVSVSTNNPESKAFSEILTLLNSALERKN